MDSAVPVRRRIPLGAQVFIGAVVGIATGSLFGSSPIVGSFGCKQLGELGSTVITLLKTLAVPLVLFAILDAFVKAPVSLRMGGRLMLFCAINVTVAMLIGLAIMNGFQPGVGAWKGLLHDGSKMASSTPSSTTQPSNQVSPATADKAAEVLAQSRRATLDPVKNFVGYIPKSVIAPFAENNVISVVLVAVVLGAALRRILVRQQQTGESSAAVVAQFIDGVYQSLIQVLHWIVRLIPFAVFGVLAQSIGELGMKVLSELFAFLVVLLSGLLLHSLVYYTFVAWVFGAKSPRQFLGLGSDAIFTALSCNSSLATVPVTLRCLGKMGVSQQSARMAACVGTNLNNDGITLYEAMAAIFISQAAGLSLGIGSQLTIVAASIMAGIGVAGIPEVGLIVLPLVLNAAGLSDATIVSALPLVMAVDWIIARVRSGVNVMSDMLIAILLDRGRQGAETPEDAPLAPDLVTTPSHRSTESVEYIEKLS